MRRSSWIGSRAVRPGRGLLALVLGLATLLVAAVPRATMAQGEDVCAEPNDDLQAACYLGPGSEALGFISRPGDIDAYRIEVLDFDVGVRVELSNGALPYVAELANWNGDTIAASTQTGEGVEVVDTTVRAPGAYYIKVRSPSGAFSDAEPYGIFRTLAYPGAAIPQVLYSSDFGGEQLSSFAGVNDVARYAEVGGRSTIAMTVGGRATEPTVAWTAWGSQFSDFTLSLDARIAAGADAGFQIFFRRLDTDNFYVVTIDARSGRAMLGRSVDGVSSGTDWVRSTAIDIRGGVNRCVVRAADDQIRVNINGRDAIVATDTTFGAGRFGFGAIAWGQPPVVEFDNVIVTTPTER